jgi:oligosaccharyltransferase complex subunit epsilon
MAGPKTAKHTASKTAVSPPPPPSTNVASVSASSTAVQTLWGAYLDKTPARLKFIDAFLVFLILSGVIQFVYCVLVTSFPFNAFLAGWVSLSLCYFVVMNLRCWDRFASTVGQFVLTASLRSQVNVTNRALFKDVSPERYVFLLIRWPRVCSGKMQGICRLCRRLGRSALFRVQLPRLIIYSLSPNKFACPTLPITPEPEREQTIIKQADSRSISYKISACTCEHD